MDEIIKKPQDNLIMKLLRLTLIPAFCMLIAGSHALKAQSLTQTVRGKILDEDTRMSLPGANIVVLETANFLGTSSNNDGSFRIDNVPVGRISLAVTFIGYEDRIVSNLLVTSGKELVLEISLKESLVMMDAITVKAGKDKSEVANEMALISARGFTVEETKRYAGSFNDPARMVSAYAGADSDPSGNNSIIVRGNSPKGIQWRLEGIDIPNPNHFSDEGATGGPINVLNSQMLTDSEFYTGAFPAEFGNALSGVFDMKLRKGNNEKQEYSFSIGILGTDATIEGPFSKKSDASYLVNYRYSTLSLLNNLGLVDFNGIPKYQDISFKVHVPTQNMGVFSIFGLGGKSNITEELFDEEPSERLLLRGYYKSNVGVAGITQYLPLGNKTFFQNSFTVSQNGSGYNGLQPDSQNDLFQTMDFNLNRNSIKALSTLHHKVNARHNIQTGLIYTHHTFSFLNSYFQEETSLTITDQDMKGDADHYQGFVSWKYRPTNNISMVSGLHAQKVSMNSEVSVEPRLSARWQFHATQAFTAGFGIHGRMESLPNYYGVSIAEDGTTYMPNRNIGFSKARHYVLGYENKLSNNLFMKAEAYYQQLYKIPVENSPGSSYSLINQVEGFTNRELINAGTGTNKGIELTLERFFANNYYFLVTSSLFDSRYTAMDGIERSTLFNSNYVGNMLLGKEFKLHSKNDKNKVLGLNGKISSLGARRFTPINLEESMAKGHTVFYEDQAFSLRGDNVFVVNFAITYRIDNKRLSQELKFDIQNATNNSAMVGQYYNNITRRIESFNQLPLLPVLIYTLHF